MSESVSISEAAERAGLTTHTMRYYEGAGLLPRIGRAESGHRRFNEGDVTWAIFITRLRATGMPIRQIRKYVDLYYEGNHTEAARLNLLEAHRDEVRARMAEMSRNLALVEMKIETYKASSAMTRALPETA